MDNLNKVIAGDYIGKKVDIKVVPDRKNHIAKNLLYIKADKGIKVFLTSETLDSYEVVDLDREKTIKNAGKGLLVGGTMGMVAGALISDGGIKVKVYFKDGSISMLQLNNMFYQKFLQGAYDVKQHTESVIKETSSIKSEQVESKSIKQCKYCKCEISSDKEICDSCSKKANKKRVPIVPIVIVAIIIIFVMAFQLGWIDTNADITEMVETMNISEVQAQAIKDTLKEVGVNNINAVAYEEGLGDYYMNGGKDKGYRVAFRGTDTNNVHNTVIVYINEDGSLLAVSEILGNVLYENGQVKNKLNKE